MEDKQQEQMVVSDQALMDKKLTSEELNSDLVIDILSTFFEERVNHQYSEERLYWLTKWIGEENHLQKIVFLQNLWMQEYFHPFASPQQTADMIESNMDKGLFNRFTVSLSSSLPEMIRVTFASCKRKGIVHRRIDISSRKPKTINDGFMLSRSINFSVLVLEEQIKKLLFHHNPHLFKVFKPIKYSSRSEDIESPKPYTEPYTEQL
jgi:hypothetical protein